MTTHNPNGPGINNGNFIGLPFTESEARLVFLPVPWEVTVSYRGGTARAPQNILHASTQLDLYEADFPNAWREGIFFMPTDKELLHSNDHHRAFAEKIIAYIEDSGEIYYPHLQDSLIKVNLACEAMNLFVEQQTTQLMEAGKIVGLVGGDHSTPLGYLRALAKRHESFGILQIDAHCDLREAYEGFTYSHASVMFNALALPQVERLVQVGIRDYCEAEAELVAHSSGRVVMFSDQLLQENEFAGKPFSQTVADILHFLPENVYVSFDVDGLDPSLCPNTGTPVAGGLSFAQAVYILKQLHRSKRRIIGFDVVETGAAEEWDGNVAARLLYTLACLSLSQ